SNGWRNAEVSRATSAPCTVGSNTDSGRCRVPSSRRLIFVFGWVDSTAARKLPGTSPGCAQCGRRPPGSPPRVIAPHASAVARDAAAVGAPARRPLLMRRWRGCTATSARRVGVAPRAAAAAAGRARPYEYDGIQKGGRKSGEGGGTGMPGERGKRWRWVYTDVGVMVGGKTKLPIAGTRARRRARLSAKIERGRSWDARQIQFGWNSGAQRARGGAGTYDVDSLNPPLPGELCLALIRSNLIEIDAKSRPQFRWDREVVIIPNLMDALLYAYTRVDDGLLPRPSTSTTPASGCRAEHPDRSSEASSRASGFFDAQNITREKRRRDKPRQRRINSGRRAGAPTAAASRATADACGAITRGGEPGGRLPHWAQPGDVPGSFRAAVAFTCTAGWRGNERREWSSNGWRNAEVSRATSAPCTVGSNTDSGRCRVPSSRRLIVVFGWVDWRRGHASALRLELSCATISDGGETSGENGAQTAGATRRSLERHQRLALSAATPTQVDAESHHLAGLSSPSAGLTNDNDVVGRRGHASALRLELSCATISDGGETSGENGAQTAGATRRSLERHQRLALSAATQIQAGEDSLHLSFTPMTPIQATKALRLPSATPSPETAHASVPSSRDHRLPITIAPLSPPGNLERVGVGAKTHSRLLQRVPRQPIAAQQIDAAEDFSRALADVNGSDDDIDGMQTAVVTKNPYMNVFELVSRPQRNGVVKKKKTDENNDFRLRRGMEITPAHCPSAEEVELFEQDRTYSRGPRYCSPVRLDIGRAVEVGGSNVTTNDWNEEVGRMTYEKLCSTFHRVGNPVPPYEVFSIAYKTRVQSLRAALMKQRKAPDARHEQSSREQMLTRIQLEHTRRGQGLYLHTDIAGVSLHHQQYVRLPPEVVSPDQPTFPDEVHDGPRRYTEHTAPYQTGIPYWRNPAEETWFVVGGSLQMSSHFTSDLVKINGNFPRQRIRTGRVISYDVEAPRGLPRNFYDPAWLRQLEKLGTEYAKDFLSEISEEFDTTLPEALLRPAPPVPGVSVEDGEGVGKRATTLHDRNTTLLAPAGGFLTKPMNVWCPQCMLLSTPVITLDDDDRQRPSESVRLDHKGPTLVLSWLPKFFGKVMKYDSPDKIVEAPPSVWRPSRRMSLPPGIAAPMRDALRFAQNDLAATAGDVETQPDSQGKGKTAANLPPITNVPEGQAPRSREERKTSVRRMFRSFS
ncbi:hypothetical protein FB107DRAFT_251681, partial [Schizophyllum commune]